MAAAVSEIPYDLAYSGRWMDAQHQNVCLTFFLALVAMELLERYGNGIWEKLVLTAVYLDAAARQCAYEAAVQSYRESGCSEEEATAKAATVQPAPEASEYATGYGADILAADSMEKDTGFADTRAYEWLEAYAAEYGFILRWPQERQAATGMVFEPWHWRYVGRDNALAIRASGLSLEEYLALEQTK